MVAALERHPHVQAVLGPALAGRGELSHAYLFHGPGGAGKRDAARAIAAELLCAGALHEAGGRVRVEMGVHPDLTWVTPSGAHEILVSDIDGPVVAAATRTPFESTRRVFVVEHADELGDEAANRMLKTLEEPPSYVHLILLTDRLAEVLPTIRSRCQLVRFEAPTTGEVAARLVVAGTPEASARACARLALGDAEQAAALAGERGRGLRAAAESYARAALAGTTGSRWPWREVLDAVKSRGDELAGELEGRRDADLELYPSKEHRRVKTEWEERIRRRRRRVETAALDLALQLVTLWFRDLLCVAVGVPEMVAHADRADELAVDNGRDPTALRKAIDLVEETRRRLPFNVTEELACEALAYRLEAVLA